MVLSAAAEVCRESAPAFATQEPNLALLLIVITGGSVRLGRPLAQAFAAAGPSLFATTELVRVFTDLHCLELA